jgi:hypothetical protein
MHAHAAPHALCSSAVKSHAKALLRPQVRKVCGQHRRRCSRVAAVAAQQQEQVQLLLDVRAGV